MLCRALLVVFAFSFAFFPIHLSAQTVGAETIDLCLSRWPNDYEMQLYCIEKQTKAKQKLDRVIVAPSIYSEWKAASTTAYAITGDISISKTKIVFQNGAYMRIIPLTNKRKNTFGFALQGRAPKLINKNTLCGEANPNFFVAEYDGTNKILVVSFYESAPAGKSPTLCASFSYTSE